MDKGYLLIGIFLLVIGFAMALMTVTYQNTKKLNLAWGCFGMFYTMGLLLLLTENPVKDALQISSNHKFYNISSLVILFIGIMLSYVIGSKKGDRYIIAGVLFSVGVHFLPFHTIYTYVLSVGLMANAIVVFYKEDSSILKVLTIDALMKLSLGMFLVFCS